MTDRLTPTERRLFDLLTDGMPHTRDAMVLAVEPDGYVEWGTVKVHVCRIRAKIKELGHDIIPRMVNRDIMYQLVKVYKPEEVIG